MASPRRILQAILIPPLAGLIAFAVVWLSPYLFGLRSLPGPGPSLGALVVAWTLPIFPLVAVLHLPIFMASWRWPRAFPVMRPVGMAGIFTGCLALIGTAWGGVGTLIGAWPDWLALAVAVAADSSAYRFFRPPGALGWTNA